MNLEEKAIIERLNEMTEQEQIALLIRNAIECDWDIHAEKDKRNFHINFGKIMMQRQEFTDYKRYKIILWSIWDGEKRIFGKFGDMFHLFLTLMERK
jgi:hypothetical protein